MFIFDGLEDIYSGWDNYWQELLRDCSLSLLKLFNYAHIYKLYNERSNQRLLISILLRAN